MIKRVSKFRDERRGNVDSGRDILEPVRRAAERRLSAAAPTRPIAAIVFAHAADTVLPAVAAPPMFFSIAAKYVAESTLPSATMSESASCVTPISVASHW